MPVTYVAVPWLSGIWLVVVSAESPPSSILFGPSECDCTCFGQVQHNHMLHTLLFESHIGLPLCKLCLLSQFWRHLRVNPIIFGNLGLDGPWSASPGLAGWPPGRRRHHHHLLLAIAAFPKIITFQAQCMGTTATCSDMDSGASQRVVLVFVTSRNAFLGS